MFQGKLVRIAAVCVGLALGLGAATFHYAEGTSYFSSDPRACANCHIMEPQFDSWQKASHHTVAGCVDCHLPTALLPKLVAKADNGWRHSKAFTLQDFHEPILINERNAAILQENCLRCHADLVHEQLGDDRQGELRCVRCHVSVGHGVRAGLGGPWRGPTETGAETR